MASQPSYLIIGAGVFGVSTAYHFIKRYPDASVQLVDRTPFPCNLAASWDWNKVIRADYGDIFYMEKALEAIELWRNDSIFKPFYHKSGLVNLDNTGLGRRMIENHHKLDTKVNAEIISPKEFKERYGGFYQHTNFDEIEEVFINHDSGWAEATKALTAFTQAAMESGVKYAAAEVDHLIFDNSKRCTGVKITGGKTVKADRVILSTGAGTAKFLADSGPDRPELQVNGRITAACVVTGIVHLDAIEGKRYTEIPVTVHGIASTCGEIMPLVPPLSENELYTVKFCRDETYKNTIKHEASGQSFSSPPNEPGQAQKTPKSGQIQRLEMVKKGFLGDAGDKIKINEYRVCWDGITPNQDFIISPHPQCEGLFIATAGSFHGWKFMPTIGRYVTDMLDGTLDKSLVQRWAWDRSNEGSAHGGLIPELELRDL